LEPSFDSYKQAISDYVTFLKSSAQQYEQAEQAAENATSDLQSDLFK